MLRLFGMNTLALIILQVEFAEEARLFLAAPVVESENAEMRWWCVAAGLLGVM